MQRKSCENEQALLIDHMSVCMCVFSHVAGICCFRVHLALVSEQQLQLS